MSEAPLISVIVPVYNGEKFIEECIDSILGQSYPNIELLVVDDGSTDDTVRIIHTFNDNRIRLFSRNNSGPSNARNFGLNHAHGEYVTFVDADDYIAPEFIETLYILIQETGADMAAASFSRKGPLSSPGKERYFTVDARGYLADVLYQRCSDNSVWGKLYKTEIWNGVRFLDMRYEDLEIYPRVCLKASTVTVTDARLYFYRPNDDSFINTFTSQRLDSLKAVELVMETVSKVTNHDNLVRAARSRKLAASFNIFLITAGQPEYEEVRKVAWNNIKQLRASCLTDASVISKIKLGIIASYVGPKALKLINSVVRKSK